MPKKRLDELVIHGSANSSSVFAGKMLLKIPNLINDLPERIMTALTQLLDTPV